MKKLLTTPVVSIILFVLLGTGVGIAAIFIGNSGGGSINLEKGLVGHWLTSPSDTTSKSYDVTPNRNHGTVTGADPTATDRKGTASKAYSFTGTNNINAGTGSTLDLTSTGTLTVTAWIKTSSATAQTIVAKSANGASQDGYRMKLTSAGKLESSLLENGGGIVFAYTSSAINDGSWHFVTVIFRGGTNAETGYIDGVSLGNGTTHGATNPSNSGSFGIGRDLLNGSDNFIGSIDDVRVYNRALSTAEITALYNSYDPSIQVSTLEKGLVGHWLTSPSDTTSKAYDVTPYRNHGTVTSATLTTDRKNQSNKAYLFNGTTAYIEVTNNASLNLTTAITQTAWVKGVAQSTKAISRKGDIGLNTRSYGTFTGLASAGGTDKFRVVLSEDGSFGTDAKDYKTSVTAFDNTWHFVAYTFSSNTLKIYVDGVEDTNPTKTVDSDIGSLYQTSVSLVHGAQMNNGVVGDFFAGSIDDVRIYNRALSSAEITALYNSYDPSIQVSTLQKGLVGHWLTSPSDTTSKAYDVTPNRNHGTVTAATLTTDRKGQSNGAYSFDGSTKKISLASLPTVIAPYTVSFWMYPKALGLDQGIVSLRGANNYPMFELYSNNKLIAYAGGEKYKYGTRVFSSGDLNTWWHVVFTVNSSSSLTAWKVYLNGVDDTGTAGGNTGLYYEPSTSGAIGIDMTTRYFNGFIDDVRIYNRALSATEVLALYNSY